MLDLVDSFRFHETLDAMIKRAALYIRVSTDGQTVENQRQEVPGIGRQFGWTVGAIYRDEGISGTKGRDQRPGFDLDAQEGGT